MANGRWTIRENSKGQEIPPRHGQELALWLCPFPQISTREAVSRLKGLARLAKGFKDSARICSIAQERGYGKPRE